MSHDNENAENICQTCEHYRVPVAISAICRGQMTGAFPELVQALDAAAKEDHARMEEERLALAHGAADDGVWRTRPRTSPYCALYEASHFFYVTHIKNPRGECPDHKPARIVKADCRSCVNLRRVAGEAADAAVLQRLADAQAGAPQVDAVARQRERVIGFIASRRAYEVNEAYRNAGWLSDEPRYLEWCSARSEPQKYWIAEALNTQGSCAQYVVRDGNQEEPTGGQPRPTPIVPLVSPDAPGPGTSQSVREQGGELVRDLTVLLREHARQVLRDAVGARANSPVGVLVDGAPPLTPEMVRRAQAVIEGITDITLKPEQRREHQEVLESAWRGNQRMVIDLSLRLIRHYVILDSLTREQMAALADDLLSSRSSTELAAWVNSIISGTHTQTGNALVRSHLGQL